MTPQQLNAMKMALEALEGLKSLYGGKGHKLHEINMIHRNHDTAITALEKALAEHAMQEVQRLGQEIEQEQLISDRINYGMSVTQGGKRIDPMSIYKEPEQEPAAWIHNFIDGGISIGKRPANLERHPDRWTALYKEPKPCPTCEALARTVMLDQTSHDTSPPAQRTWVELTDEQIEDCYKQGGIGRAIQLFKEKNT